MEEPVFSSTYRFKGDPMKNTALATTLLVLSFTLLDSTTAVAQTASDDWTVPRTIDGRPDLQGVWSNNSATPLERPVQLADRVTLTDEEQSKLAARARELFGGDGDAAFGDGVFTTALAEAEDYTSTDGGTGNYNGFWMAQREFNDRRTSLVVDPPTGRVPVNDETKAARAALRPDRTTSPDGPEEAGLAVRCISYGGPYLWAGYNSYHQIIQTKHHVVIVQEMIHDARIIPITDRPHVDDNIRQWHGDSRGYWDGDTLVVETTNYRTNEGNIPVFFTGGGTENRRIVERFNRAGPDTVRWQVTLEDPATWTQPWTAVMMLSRTEDAMFEYACHEGNIGLHGILAGTRVLEQASGQD